MLPDLFHVGGERGRPDAGDQLQVRPDSGNKIAVFVLLHDAPDLFGALGLRGQKRVQPGAKSRLHRYFIPDPSLFQIVAEFSPVLLQIDEHIVDHG